MSQGKRKKGKPVTKTYVSTYSTADPYTQVHATQRYLFDETKTIGNSSVTPGELFDRLPGPPDEVIQELIRSAAAKAPVKEESYVDPRNSNPQPLSPPKLAEFAIHLLVPKKDREALIGDLAEEFKDIEERYGRRKAQLWYWVQLAWSAWPVISGAVRQLRNWAVLRWVGEFIKHLAH